MNHFTIFGTTQNITQVSAPAGTNIVNYTLAVARGGTQPTWDYFVVSTYGKQAEFASSLKDGDMVLVSGYLQDSGIEKADTKWLIATQQTVMQAVRMPFPINIILLMGRLTKDPEVRTTSEGKPVANLRIAVDRISRGGSGENTANYIDIISFEKTAEFAAKYLKKGMKIIVTGYIRNNNYTNKEGLQVYRDAVYATRIEFAESKSSANGTNQYGAPAQATQYGAPTQATQYGAPARATQYGAPAQTTQYGAPVQTQPYGAPVQTQPYGTPVQTQPYGTPVQTQPYGTPVQTQPYGTPVQTPPAPAAPVAPMTQAPPAPPAPTAPAASVAPVAPAAPMTQAPPAPTAPAAPMTQAPPTPTAPAAPMTQAPPAPVAPVTQATQAPPVHQGEGYVPAPAAYMDNNLPFA